MSLNAVSAAFAAAQKASAQKASAPVSSKNIDSVNIESSKTVKLMRDLLEKKKEELAGVRGELASAKDKLADAERHNLENKKLFEDLSKQQADSGDNFAELRNVIQEQLKEKDDRILGLEKSTAGLEKELEHSAATRDAAIEASEKARAGEMEKGVAELELRIPIAGDLKASQAKCEGLEKKCEGLEKKCAALEEKCLGFESALKTKSAAYEGQTQKFLVSESVLQQLRSKVTEQQKSINILQANNSYLTMAFTDVKHVAKNVEELRDSVRHGRDEVDEVRKSVNDSHNTLFDQIDKVDRHVFDNAYNQKHAYEYLKEDISGVDLSVKKNTLELGVHLENAWNHSNTVQQNSALLQARNEALQRQVEDLKAQRDELEEENRQFRVAKLTTIEDDGLGLGNEDDGLGLDYEEDNINDNVPSRPPTPTPTPAPTPAPAPTAILTYTPTATPPLVERQALLDLDKLQALTDPAQGTLVSYSCLSTEVQSALRNWANDAETNKFGDGWYEKGLALRTGCFTCIGKNCFKHVQEDAVCGACVNGNKFCIRRREDNVVLYPLCADDRSLATPDQLSFWFLTGGTKRKSKHNYDTQAKRKAKKAAT
ncbi:hypothetical protein CC80DRAFT_550163 [Byssothecium circinans]|uniref:Uncharacterized protein n=1 Tax=Byssothecium circinans TaxID=147558 RepID=A0A6A5TV42_9PLEO|nr:hypothetical protein CC80DRAFT_550163 [Byssothecium circinans]